MATCCLCFGGGGTTRNREDMLFFSFLVWPHHIYLSNPYTNQRSRKKIVNFFSHLSPLALIIIIIIVVCCCWQQQMKDWIKFLMIGDWWPLTIREYFCKIFFHELWLIIMMTCITTKTMMVIGLKSKKKNSLLVLIMLMLVMMR